MIRLPKPNDIEKVDCSHHDGFARAVWGHYRLMAFHPQDERLEEVERRLILSLFPRGHDRGPALEIYDVRSMLAFNPAILEPAHRMTLNWAWTRIHNPAPAEKRGDGA